MYSAIVDWLKAAEEDVVEDYQGIDYEILEKKLALHKVRVHLILQVFYCEYLLVTKLFFS